MADATQFSRDRPAFYIGGGWRRPQGTGIIDVIDPSSEERIASVPDATAADVDAAVAAARDAFEGWAATDPVRRADLCDELADRMDAIAPEIAELVTAEVGTPSLFSGFLQAGAAGVLLRQAAEIARGFEWQHTRDGSLLVHEPIGVVAAIVPWNYPLTLASYKVPYALAAGCTVVLKPSELAPLSLFRLADEVDAVGFPPGTFNLVTGGPDAGARLVEHPDVDMVSFTGSTATGAKVMAGAAATVKRVHLELGGKSAAILLGDADIAAAVSNQLQQCFLNSGQTCLAWSRFLVPRVRQEEVVAALVEQVSAVYQAGHPSSALVGPMVSAAQRERVLDLIAQGGAEGARLVVGGAKAPAGFDRGFYVQPTVFADVTNDMTIAQEEIFGPVLCVIPYDSEEDAIRIANDSPYGLHGAVYSSDVDHAVSVAKRIRTGQVDINSFAPNPYAPFGGYKQSGIGKELGRSGFESFLEVKAIQGASA